MIGLRSYEMRKFDNVKTTMYNMQNKPVVVVVVVVVVVNIWMCIIIYITIIKVARRNVDVLFCPWLYWHPDSNRRGGPETPRQKCNTGLVIGWTRNIHSDISLTPSLIFFWRIVLPKRSNIGLFEM